MKRNILLVADGDIESDLNVVDAAARTTHEVRRASTRSRPAQILRRKMDDLDAVIVDLDEHTQALSIVEALGCSENRPPVIVRQRRKWRRSLTRHGATVCVIKPFNAGDLASVIGNVCLQAHPGPPKHPVEPISIATSQASFCAPPD
jgi:hypothetical protein